MRDSGLNRVNPLLYRKNLVTDTQAGIKIALGTSPNNLDA
jgi:hypothetical protein